MLVLEAHPQVTWCWSLRIFQCRHKASCSFENVYVEGLLCWKLFEQSCTKLWYVYVLSSCSSCLRLPQAKKHFQLYSRRIPALIRTERYKCEFSVEWLNLCRWHTLYEQFETLHSVDPLSVWYYFFCDSEVSKILIVKGSLPMIVVYLYVHKFVLMAELHLSSSCQ